MPYVMSAVDPSWRSVPFTNPANDQVIAAVPESTPSDVDAALQAARIAFTEWRHVNPAVRAGRGR